MTVKAIWHNVTIAEAEKTTFLEGNHYFPSASVDSRYLQPSSSHTSCPWKGVASYYDVVVGENVNPNAAWYYPTPSAAAKEITGCIAFWKGVLVVVE